MILLKIFSKCGGHIFATSVANLVQKYRGGKKLSTLKQKSENFDVNKAKNAIKH
jgi:hypothetical protein